MLSQNAEPRLPSCCEPRAEQHEVADGVRRLRLLASQAVGGDDLGVLACFSFIPTEQRNRGGSETIAQVLTENDQVCVCVVFEPSLLASFLAKIISLACSCINHGI